MLSLILISYYRCRRFHPVERCPTIQVAFDLMTMPLRLLPALPALTPALLCVFAEELDDDAAGSATANAITNMPG